VIARGAIVVSAALALLALLMVAAVATAALAAPRGHVDGRPAAAAASVHRLDGRPAPITPSVHRLDGRPAPITPSVHRLDGHAAGAAASVHRLDGRPAAAAPSVRLTIDFARRPGAAHAIAHVRCGASGGSVDGFLRRVGAPRACAQARRIARLLTGQPDPHRACSQIYGGPERALVTGTIGGRRIRHGFSRTNGCGIADWRRAMPLLPRPT